MLTVSAKHVTIDQLVDVLKGICWNYLSIVTVYRLRGDFEIGQINKYNRSKAFCLTFKLSNENNIKLEELQQYFNKLAYQLHLDVGLYREKYDYKLIAFSLDNILIKSNILHELGLIMGVADQFANIDNEIENNKKFSHQEGLKKKLALLATMEVSKLNLVWSQMQISDEVNTLLATVAKYGYKTAIISKGFNFYVQGIKKKLNIDYAVGNDLRIRNNMVTGQINNLITKPQDKVDALKELCAEENISLDDIVYVGNDLFDIPALESVGLGIVYHTNSEVLNDEINGIHINNTGLSSILHFLGIGESDFAAQR